VPYLQTPLDFTPFKSHPLTPSSHRPAGLLPHLSHISLSGAHTVETLSHLVTALRTRAFSSLKNLDLHCPNALPPLAPHALSLLTAAPSVQSLELAPSLPQPEWGSLVTSLRERRLTALRSLSLVLPGWGHLGKIIFYLFFYFIGAERPP
jgi:hypothetical protein